MNKMNKLKANVKFYSEDKGFGFLIEQQTGKEYFMHVTGMLDKVSENDEVTFDLIDGKKGPCAANVQLVN